MKSIWNQILRYLYIRKRDANEVRNTNTKIMHGMNRISIIIFTIVLIILIVRLIRHFL